MHADQCFGKQSLLSFDSLTISVKIYLQDITYIGSGHLQLNKCFCLLRISLANDGRHRQLLQFSMAVLSSLTPSLLGLKEHLFPGGMEDAHTYLVSFHFVFSFGVRVSLFYVTSSFIEKQQLASFSAHIQLFGSVLYWMYIGLSVLFYRVHLRWMNNVGLYNES